jgi:hypothetical protein
MKVSKIILPWNDYYMCQVLILHDTDTCD